jgi:hypothetical protein
VPFRNYSQFNTDALVIMTDAYDAAVAKLGIQPTDPRTAELASKIVTLFTQGEREAAALAEKASAELGR